MAQPNLQNTSSISFSEAETSSPISERPPRFTLSSWNIMGPSAAKAQDKKALTTKYFGESLKADFICIQGLQVQCDTQAEKGYIPIVGDYRRVVCNEPSSNTRNVIYFNEKFEQCDEEEIVRAFEFMKYKRDFYADAEVGDVQNTIKINNMTIERAIGIGADGAQKEALHEVTAELSDQFKAALKEMQEKYKPMPKMNESTEEPNNPNFRLPEEILKTRMALSCFKLRSNPKYKVVVGSLRNYYHGEADSENYLDLLNDFIKGIRIPYVIVGTTKEQGTPGGAELSLVEGVEECTLNTSHRALPRNRSKIFQRWDKSTLTGSCDVSIETPEKVFHHDAFVITLKIKPQAV